MQEAASFALLAIAADNATTQLQVARLGGISLLISRDLPHDLPPCSPSISNDLAPAQVARLGGIPPLISLVHKSSSIAAQEHAAKALWHLGSTSEHQIAIAEAGGIAPLVALLSAGGQRAPELAAVTIVRLADGNPEVSKTIAEVGGIAPLVALLSHGSLYAQQQAASALGECTRAQHRHPLTRAPCRSRHGRPSHHHTSFLCSRR